MEGTEHAEELYRPDEEGERNEYEEPVEREQQYEYDEEYIYDEEEEEVQELPKACELATGDRDVRLRLEGFAFMPPNPHAPTKEPIPVMRYTWRTRNRMSVQLINYGSTITSIKVPNSKGYVHDIIMGFDDLESYMDRHNPYFGATIGRVANIISEGTYTHRKEKIELKVNKPPHHINGGKLGFDKVLWEHHNEGPKVIMSHHSISNTEGYPGNLIVNISYEVTSANRLIIEMTASCDAVTPVNLTNELYFNLAGHGAGPGANYKHIITVNAEKYTALKDKLVPNGKIRHVGGTPFDLRVPRGLGIMIRKTPDKGFNLNFCIKKDADQKMVFNARIYHPDTGRIMEIYSDQPGLQFSTANSLPDTSNATAQMLADSSYHSGESEGSKTDSKGKKTRNKGNMTDLSQTGGDGTAGYTTTAITENTKTTEEEGFEGSESAGKSKRGEGVGADTGEDSGGRTRAGKRTKKDGAGARTSETSDIFPRLPKGVPCTDTCPCALTDEQRKKLLEKYQPEDWDEDGTGKSGKAGVGQSGSGEDGKDGGAAGGGTEKEREEARRRAAEDGQGADARKQWTDDWGDGSEISDTSLMAQRYGAARGAGGALFSESGMKGKAGAAYCKHGAFVMQTQAYPNAPNQKNFPVIWLHPEENYKHRIVYKFGILYKPDEVPGVLELKQMEDEATLTSSFSSAPENYVYIC